MFTGILNTGREGWLPAQRHTSVFMHTHTKDIPCNILLAHTMILFADMNCKVPIIFVIRFVRKKEETLKETAEGVEINLGEENYQDSFRSEVLNWGGLSLSAVEEFTSLMSV